MMRKRQVYPTRMNIETIAEHFAGHGAAFNMPARTALSKFDVLEYDAVRDRRQWLTRNRYLTGPHGEGQAGSPDFDFFQRAKSAGFFFPFTSPVRSPILFWELIHMASGESRMIQCPYLLLPAAVWCCQRTMVLAWRNRDSVLYQTAWYRNKLNRPLRTYWSTRNTEP